MQSLSDSSHAQTINGLRGQPSGASRQPRPGATNLLGSLRRLAGQHSRSGARSSRSLSASLEAGRVAESHKHFTSGAAQEAIASRSSGRATHTHRNRPLITPSGRISIPFAHRGECRRSRCRSTSCRAAPHQAQLVRSRAPDIGRVETKANASSPAGRVASRSRRSRTEAVVDDVAQTVAQLEFRLQEARRTIGTLQHERELAERLEQAIRQLSLKAGRMDDVKATN